jgi:hypothetical protein
MGTKTWSRVIRLTSVAVAIGARVGIAWGGEYLGTVRTIDQAQRTVLLSDGTRLWLLPGLSLELFGEGKRIKVIYEERDGKKWVRSVEAAS